MGWLCDEARRALNFASSIYSEQTITSASVWSRSVFLAHIEFASDQYLTRIPTEFGRLYRFVLEMFHCTLLPTAFNTDWSVQYGNQSNGYLLRSTPRLFINGSCNCMSSGECQQPVRVGPPNLILPGLVIGCLPIDGLRLSTLECFYSSECIANIIQHLGYYTEIDGSLPVNFTASTSSPLVVPPMNRSAPSRFPVITPIDTLITELFIERWGNTTSYEAYYAACAPIECQYKYATRNDPLNVVTTLLGLYGGLTVSLRFITWNLTLLCRWVKNKHRSGRQNQTGS